MLLNPPERKARKRWAQFLDTFYIMKFIITTFLLLLFSSLAISQNKTIIKLKKQNGVYSTVCLINGKAASFIYDSGAADVLLSKDFFTEGIKTGLFKSSDLLPGVFNYRIANNEIVTGRKINIRELKIGNLRLFNVLGSINEIGDAPFLLGQTAIERFGNFHSSYSNDILTLTISGNPKSDLDLALETAKKIALAKKNGIPANIQRQISQSKVDLLHDLKVSEGLEFEVSSIKNNNNELSFEYDITNNSGTDYKLKALSQLYIFIDVFTESGKVYSTSISAPQMLAGNTVNGQTLSLKLHDHKPTYFRLYGVVNGPYLSSIEN